MNDMGHDENGNCSQVERLKRIEEIVNETHTKLFVGNGQPSFSVRISDMESFVNGLKVALGAVGISALIGGIGTLFYHLFKAV